VELLGIFMPPLNHLLGNQALKVFYQNEILFAGKWMEVEIIMSSEISHSQKDKYHMFSLICRI
jgi:hypothetical protein